MQRAGEHPVNLPYPCPATQGGGQNDAVSHLLIVQNRLLKTLGYATVRYVEDAPEYAGVSSAAAVAS